jgi:hypothetical protein
MRTPERRVRWKSAERVILMGLGSTGSGSPDSGGELLAALAAACGHNGAARAGPHPEAKTMGTAAAAVARLERALAHGKAPTIGLVTGSVGDWTSRPRTLRPATF